jgi:hypothetical protein
VSEAAEAKALELARAEGMPNDHVAPTGPYTGPLVNAFARYIQRVSDAAKVIAHTDGRTTSNALLDPFILPDPLLMEARKVAAANWDQHYTSDVLEGTYDASPVVVAALAGIKRGLAMWEVQP